MVEFDVNVCTTLAEISTVDRTRHQSLYYCLCYLQFIQQTGEFDKGKMQAQQGRRARTPSVGGASSLYSYASTTRTMSRSMKSLRVAWYKKPLVQDAFFTDIQTGSLMTAVFSMVG